jgi:hypothetical protein
VAWAFLIGIITAPYQWLRDLRERLKQASEDKSEGTGT